MENEKKAKIIITGGYGVKDFDLFSNGSFELNIKLKDLIEHDVIKGIMTKEELKDLTKKAEWLTPEEVVDFFSGRIAKG